MQESFADRTSVSVRNSLVTRSALLQKSLSIRSDPASIELVDDPTPKRRWRLEGVQESCSKIDSASVTHSLGYAYRSPSNIP